MGFAYNIFSSNICYFNYNRSGGHWAQWVKMLLSNPHLIFVLLDSSTVSIPNSKNAHPWRQVMAPAAGSVPITQETWTVSSSQAVAQQRSLSHPISSSLLLCPCLSACQIKAFFKWGKKDSKIFLNWKDDFLFIFQKYSFGGIGTSPSFSPSSLSIFPFHNEKRFFKNYNCYFSN